jgi:lipopolysaccharide export system protein LptA
MALRPFSPRLNSPLPLFMAFFAFVFMAAWPGGPLLADEAGSVKSKDAPIVVTARTLVADNKKKTAVYKKDVVVKKGDMTLYADTVTVHLKDTGKSPDKAAKGQTDIVQGSGKIDTIEAKGSVKIIQQDKTATADEATYYSDADKIVLTGKPRVWQGDNVITGNRISYNIKEDTFSVDEATTVLYQVQGGGAGPAPKPGSGK